MLFKRQNGELRLTAANIIFTILIILLIVYRNDHHDVTLVKTNGLWLALAFPFQILYIDDLRAKSGVYVKLSD